MSAHRVQQCGSATHGLHPGYLNKTCCSTWAAIGNGESGLSCGSSDAAALYFTHLELRHATTQPWDISGYSGEIKSTVGYGTWKKWCWGDRAGACETSGFAAECPRCAGPTVCQEAGGTGLQAVVVVVVVVCGVWGGGCVFWCFHRCPNRPGGKCVSTKAQ
jgi:hypothetical protein